MHQCFLPVVEVKHVKIKHDVLVYFNVPLDLRSFLGSHYSIKTDKAIQINKDSFLYIARVLTIASTTYVTKT